VEVRTGSPDPDSPSFTLSATGDSEPGIVGIWFGPQCVTAAPLRSGYVEPAAGPIHAAACCPAQSKAFAVASGSEVAQYSMCVARSWSPIPTLARGRSKIFP
jgi:hypothetical protein